MKIFLISIFVLLNLSLLAQKKQFKFTVDHYAINVSNLDSSVEFYQSYLFLEEIYDGTEKDHIRWFSLGKNQELHIISIPGIELSIPKGVHMALTIPTLNHYLTFLSENDITYYDWPGNTGKVSTRPDSIQQIYIQDPDGYWIEINNGITRFK